MNPCSFCDGRCCESFVITVNAFDVLRIEKETGRKAEEFAELRRLDILSYEEEMVIEAKNKGSTDYYLLALKSHPCYFFRNRRCEIYSFRPLACRIYPFAENGKMSRRALCPIVSKIGFFFYLSLKNIIEQYKKEKEEYEKIVKECNEKKFEKEEAFDFIIKKAKTML